MKKTVFLLVFLIGSMSLSGFANIEGYENVQTSELTYEQFIQYTVKLINEQRGLEGLLPLNYEPLASCVAKEYANDLIKNQYFSYCSLKGKCPDERYTLAGGTGATLEIIKGFEDYGSENNIKLTPMLAKHLTEALVVNEDDSKICFSPFITHIGLGVEKDDVKNKFVAVVEFLTIGGEFNPLVGEIVLGEKLKISGKVKAPFKFKAISVAYLDRNEEETPLNDFDIDYLKPYFPPQDYIAYGSKSRAAILNILKGLGFIGAIGASPFTGGASAILAPIFLHSLQSGPPREIPLKGGIKLSSKGEFAGEIILNYQSMTGLYYVSVLAGLESIDYPIVISRRIVRVKEGEV